jgi:hypothetical protein
VQLWQCFGDMENRRCVFRRIRPPSPTENGHLVQFNSAAQSAPLESTRSRRRR